MRWPPEASILGCVSNIPECTHPYTARLDDLAADVGRLRYRTDTAEWMIDRLATHVESLDCMTYPTAAELVQDGFSVPGALATVERRAMQLRTLLRAD